MNEFKQLEEEIIKLRSLFDEFDRVVVNEFKQWEEEIIKLRSLFDEFDRAEFIGVIYLKIIKQANYMLGLEFITKKNIIELLDIINKNVVCSEFGFHVVISDGNGNLKVADSWDL